MDESIFTRLGKVKLSDWLRGLIVAVITAPLTIIYQSVQAGSLTFDWKAVVTTALAGGLAYLIKNMATGENGKLLTNN